MIFTFTVSIPDYGMVHPLAETAAVYWYSQPMFTGCVPDTETLWAFDNIQVKESKSRTSPLLNAMDFDFIGFRFNNWVMVNIKKKLHFLYLALIIENPV